MNDSSSPNIPLVLSIAGSDSSGGAGIQADLKVITALGGYGMTAVTAITAQNTLGVTQIQAIDLDVIEAQIDVVIADMGVDVVKIGMLATPEIVRVVAKTLRRHQVKQIILDPVLQATSGASLGGNETAAAMREDLFPITNLITPNLSEASILLGRVITQAHEFPLAAQELMQLGPQAVLIKGGHLPNAVSDLTDYLLWQSESGIQFREFHHRRIDTINTHGSGCTLAAAIATYLASGLTLDEAVAKAIDYVEAGIVAGQYLNLGSGAGPLWHMHAFYPQSNAKQD